MKTLRKVDKYELFHEPLQGLYRVSDGLDLSMWFDLETKNELMKLPMYKFTKKCKKLISESLVS